MRLVVILLISGIIQVSAASYGQRLTLEQKGIRVKDVFKAIKRQTGYDVLWQNGQLRTERRLDANFNQASLDQVMATCLLGQNLTFIFDEQSIIVREKKDLKNVTTVNIRQDSVLYTGRVTDENGKPMAGATVRVKYSTRGFLTNNNGEFRLYVPKGESKLLVSYVGYGIKEIPVKSNESSKLEIQLLPATGTLSEVSVVSNGYEDIAKERATGSFEVVTAKQLEHSNDPNLLKRLEGITTSMNFNNNNTFNTTISGSLTSINNYKRSPLADLTIRGKNTLSSSVFPFQNSGFPLLVIDGVASAYNIDQLDPESIESVTILKDAASASIWGSRAANGVLVVKTKKGSYLQSPSISFVSNFNITEKPNLFYSPKMSVSDYIDAQRLRFINAKTIFSTPTATASQPIESPVEEIMNDYLNKNTITEAQANAQLDELRKNDVRNDVLKYLIRVPVTQNYTLAVTGGSKKMAYRVSIGYSNSQGNTQNSESDRLVLGYNGSLKPLKKLEIHWNTSYILQNRNFQGPGTFVGTSYSQFQPYDKLALDNGNPLILPKSYRPAFVDVLKNTYGSKILDMTYKPLEEMNLGSLISKIQGINLSMNSIYRFDPSLTFNLTYSYNRQIIDDETFYSRDSYFIRELTNRFTDPSTLKQSIPYGDFMQPTHTTLTGNTLRGQMNYSHTWRSKHAINAILGLDISQNYSYSYSNTYLGYDREKLTFNNNLSLGTGGLYNFLYSVRNVPFGIPPFIAGIQDNRSRTVSNYANAAYTFDNRYTISGSIRRDGSNLYGTAENRNGTPFYSAGLSWNLANESFYNFDFLPILQLRATYGYNGNTNPAAYPRPRISYSSNVAISGLAYASVPPFSEGTNGQLRPEKTGILNLGLTFGLKNGRLSGSVEYYTKETKDLITTNLLDPSTGFSNLLTNTGDLHGYGSDLTLNSQNIHIGKFNWTSNFLFSSNRVKVSKLYVPGGTTAGRLVTGTGSSTYNEGYDLSRIFAFPWAGLDPQTGNPRIILNGQAMVIDEGAIGLANYNSLNSSAPSAAKYIGSSVPIYFGSLRNSFSFGSLMVSANLLYKFKYYTRRPQADLAYYSTLYAASAALIGGEFNRRWLKPGDEIITNVPSLTYPGSEVKDYVYAFSDINVIKADHIRLQEVNISWSFKKLGWGVKNARLYANVTNLGIIWRSNTIGIDPDINDVPNPRAYSIGLSANF